MLRTSAARAALAVAALLVAPACSKEGTVHFDLTKTYTISNVSTFGPEVKSVDLKSEAGEAWAERDKIKSVRVTKVTVVASNVQAASGTTGDGSFKVRPSGTSGAADVLAGSFTNVPIVNGTWLDTVGTPEVNGAVDAALRGDGQLSFVAEAHTTSAFSATVTVTVLGEVDYKIDIL